MMDNLLLGICILLLGVMFYYFNGRLSILESTMVKQNHVLSDFITNVKSNTSVQGGSVQENTSNHGATIEAMHVASRYHDTSQNSQDMEYIEVTDSDNGSTTSEDSSSSDDTIKEMTIVTEPLEVKPEVKVIRLGEIEDVRSLDTLLKEKLVEPLDEEEDDDGITVDIHDGSDVDYSKMKVSQLRLILADKGIVPKGKKKVDLVNALQENNL